MIHSIAFGKPPCLIGNHFDSFIPKKQDASNRPNKRHSNDKIALFDAFGKMTVIEDTIVD